MSKLHEQPAQAHYDDCRDMILSACEIDVLRLPNALVDERTIVAALTAYMQRLG